MSVEDLKSALLHYGLNRNHDPYYCKFEVDPRQLKIDELAAKYHDLCERYDRAVCSGKSKYDGCAVPVTPYQSKLVSHNAHQVKEMIMIEAMSNSITRCEMMRAISNYHKRPVKLEN